MDVSTIPSSGFQLCSIRISIRHSRSDNPRPRPHELHKRTPHHQRRRHENNIRRARIPPKHLRCERVEPRLRKVADPRKADDKPIHRAEGLEPEHLGRVVRDGRVVEGAVDDEECDVGVPRRGAVRNAAQDADERGGRDEDEEDGGRGGYIEDETGEGDGDEPAEGEEDVEDLVELPGQMMRREEPFVLLPDRRDEVVDAQHLDDREEGDEDEPGRTDLLERGCAVHRAPDAAGRVSRFWLG